MFNKLGTHIKCKDLDQSLPFYLSLGFMPVFAYGDEDFFKKLPKELDTAPESYNGIIFQVGHGTLEIATGHTAVKPEVFQEAITSSKVSATIEVESVDEIVRMCEEYKIKISVPIKKYPWGTREVVVKDPDGYILVFIEKI